MLGSNSRSVATLVLAVRRSNYSARFHPLGLGKDVYDTIMKVTLFSVYRSHKLGNFNMMMKEKKSV